MKIALLSLASSLFVACLPAAEPSATTAEPGPKVGQAAAAFTLPAPAGGDVSLASLTAAGPVAVVFVRSADWCPFCRKQLEELQKELPSLQSAGIQVVAISYDSPTVNLAATKKLGLTYPLLSDSGSKIIDAYGLRNEQAKGRAEGVPHPAILVVDRKGIIRSKLMRENYRDRPAASEILAAARSLK
ncbi:MAG: peroxiredoxin family protein [Opitutaceae bacterium]|jgi:peroxiredoxin|nr:peroxiredoxin family protein [Opitutaceae bacterium]